MESETIRRQWKAREVRKEALRELRDRLLPIYRQVYSPPERLWMVKRTPDLHSTLLHVIEEWCTENDSGDEWWRDAVTITLYHWTVSGVPADDQLALRVPYVAESVREG